MSSAVAALAAVGAVVGALGGAGCTVQLNDRPTIGGELLLPAIAPEPVVPSVAELPSPTPAPYTFDREAWEPVAFVVPVDGTVHYPRFHTPLRVTDPESRRKIGLYPTLLSSLETRQMGLGESAWEITVAPFLALWEALLIPVRVFTIPAWEELQTPGSPPLRLYKRTDGEEWYAGSGLPAVTIEPDDELAPVPAETIEPGPAEEELPDDEDAPLDQPALDRPVPGPSLEGGRR